MYKLLDAHLHQRHENAIDTRGRNYTLPKHVVETITKVLVSVLSTKATRFTSTQLIPFVVGVIIAEGFGDTIREGGRGIFSCSRHFIWRLAKANGWSFSQPAGGA